MDDRWSSWKTRALDFPLELKDRMPASEYGMLTCGEDFQLLQDFVNAYQPEKLPSPYLRAARRFISGGEIQLLSRGADS